MLRKETKQQLTRLFAEKVKLNLSGKAASKAAIESGISTSTMSLIVRGKNNVKLTTLFHLAEALEIKASYLISLMENDLPEDFTLIE